MRRLLLLLVILSTVTPARADYWIGTYRYSVVGAEAYLEVYCQADRRILTLVLTATDSAGRTYWLGEHSAEPDITRSHAGLVALDGEYLIWLPHRVGDRAILSMNGGPCWRAVEDVRYVARAWAPLIVR